MPKVISVRFRTSTKPYFFAPVGDDSDYKKGTVVVVETQRGIEYATVSEPPHEVDESDIVKPLGTVTRIATEEELEAVRRDNEKKPEIIAKARELISKAKLDMKIVDCDFTVDHSKIILYFTADNRVDFRELVRDLAGAFHARIDLRQIGAREECKLIGSLAPCGMPCCCGRFESDCEHVSIKMAKNQNLALTPGKINGMCGRLLCCLGYENKFYEEITKKAPKHGTIVEVDGRRGFVVNVTPLKETAKVRFGTDENFEFQDVPLSALTVISAPVRPDKNNTGGIKGRAVDANSTKPERDNRANNGQGKTDNRANNGQNRRDDSRGEGRPRDDKNNRNRRKFDKRDNNDKRQNRGNAENSDKAQVDTTRQDDNTPKS